VDPTHTVAAREVLLWLSTATLLYVYAGYPLLLAILCFLRRPPVRPFDVEPAVTIIVPAYNEERVIEAKIRNTLELDYPDEKLSTLVISDGSSDRTAELAAAAIEGSQARALDFPRQGKVKLLTDALRYASGEIIVVTDATVMLHRNAIRSLVRHYSDSSVAAVGGSYRVGASRLDQLYWRYEAYLKAKESALGCACSVHGPLYSFRKDLYQAPSPRILNDDDVIPLNLLSRGYRVQYEPDAIATDLDETRSFRQRIRTMAGNLQACSEIKALCTSCRMLPLLFFLSHTVLRLCVPLLLLSMAVLSVSLFGSSAESVGRFRLR
jgi:cellulose synthase/poly-beta-1,6-N-acetylglucosamine synthase-like glycosyltransferase